MTSSPQCDCLESGTCLNQSASVKKTAYKQIINTWTTTGCWLLIIDGIIKKGCQIPPINNQRGPCCRISLHSWSYVALRHWHAIQILQFISTTHFSVSILITALLMSTVFMRMCARVWVCQKNTSNTSINHQSAIDQLSLHRRSCSSQVYTRFYCDEIQTKSCLVRRLKHL